MAGDGVSSVATQGLRSLLSSDPGRDFLVRSNGDQVKIDELKGKSAVALYFSASWCGPCQRFTPNLIEAYNDIASREGDFEIVFVSADEDEESFNGYFSKMPWLAIPFSDSSSREKLDELFKVKGIPSLVVLGEKGEVLTDRGVEIIQEYGGEGYPFTVERVEELKERLEAERREQTLRSVLVSASRDFVISKDGTKVPVSDLEGKSIALYFSLSSYRYCVKFTSVLVEIYEKLKAREENFEIILIPLDDDEESFQQGFGSMPWLSLPFKDRSCEKLVRYFEISTLPTLVVLGPDGKTLHPNVVEAIEEYGIQAYPFTPGRFLELADMEKVRQEAQTLESLLVSGELDFVLDKGGAKVSVSSLVGKSILLYFSAHWCPPCRAFLPKLIEAYHKIKEKVDVFEVIFISSDQDQAAFDEFFATMPWLALPFGDQRKQSLVRVFKVKGIPKLVAVSPTGKTVSTEARELITKHGSEAYPFTEERLKEIEAGYEEMAKGWPQKLKHDLHPEHELLLTRESVVYTCDGCEEDGYTWSFGCEECNFQLHPKCALQEETGSKDDEGVAKAGWICDGDVCVRAS
ncbi:putative nucleoredoxin 1 [Drosera capensis]